MLGLFTTILVALSQAVFATASLGCGETVAEGERVELKLESAEAQDMTPEWRAIHTTLLSRGVLQEKVTLSVPEQWLEAAIGSRTGSYKKHWDWIRQSAMTHAYTQILHSWPEAATGQISKRLSF